MKKYLFLFLAMLFTLTHAFGQLSKDDQKKLKKLKKEYEFVSIDKYQIDDNFKCENIFVGSYIYGVNDGGGAPRNAVKNIKLITIDNKTVKEINDFIILLPLSNNHKDFANLIRIESTKNGLVGFMTNCGEIILQPKYNYINGFNKDGYAVAFSEKNIDVIDTKGNSVLKHKLYYEFDYQNSRTYPLSNQADKLQVVDNNLIAKRELNGNYGIYNVKEGKFLTDTKYSEIDLKPLNINKKSYYRVKYNDKYSLYDIETNTEVIPNLFSEIENLFENNSKMYVSGITQKEPYNYNWYDINTRSFILPTTIVSSRLSPIKGHQNLWIVKGQIDENQNDLGNGIYDIQQKKYVLEPKEDYEDIRDMVLFNTLQISTKQTRFKEFYSLDQRKLLELEISNKKLGGGVYPKKIRLRNNEGNEEDTFVIFMIQPNGDFKGAYHVIYDKNWKEVYKGLINNDKVIDNNLTFDIIEYDVNGLKHSSPAKIDFEGNIVR